MNVANLEPDVFTSQWLWWIVYNIPETLANVNY